MDETPTTQRDDDTAALVRGANPISHDEFDPAALARIVDHVTTEHARRPSRVGPRPLPRRGAWAFASIVTIILIISTTLILSSAPSVRSSGVTAPQWTFVSDVSPAWQAVHTSVSGVGGQLTCVTTTKCFAWSDVTPTLEVTTNAGMSWRPLSVAPGVGLARAISCSSELTCSVAGVSRAKGLKPYAFSLYTTVDGGTHWHKTNPIPVAVPTFLVCASAAHCLVTSDEMYFPSRTVVTNNGGLTWHPVPIPRGVTTTAGRCFTDGYCLVVGGPRLDGTLDVFPKKGITSFAAYSRDGGETWRESFLPHGGRLGWLSALWCTSSSDCAIATDQLLSTTNGGETYRTASTVNFGVTVPFAHTGPTPEEVTSIACWSATTCWVSGLTPQHTGAWTTTNGFISLTRDGGRIWKVASLPSGVASVYSVSCPSASTCFALAASQTRGSDKYRFTFLRVHT